MFISSKNHILIPGTDGQAAVRIPRGFVGDVPDWVCGTDYFKALVKCGKITLPANSRENVDKAPNPKAPKGKRSASRAKTPSSVPRPGEDETPPESTGENPQEDGVDTGGDA